MKIMRHRQTARRITDEESLKRIKEQIAAPEQKLRATDASSANAATPAGRLVKVACLVRWELGRFARS
ncbi:hypothetical protein [Bradyrhizobium roseum]|uniref:hypothetical protein n=1 Tax=Bradyrhizobium roseum TaxID=3056648 RepID=UPI0026121568|nr:hypothetical protein [Bradyrhizobium roseus]WKA31511.1 hypothetical protein QUH67_15720 [Bradyrhizobium roseus]